MGYAKLATLMKELREENPNTMLLDAGDMIQGTIYVNLSKGETATKLANALGYDFMASGNHEYDFGYEQLAKLTKMFEFPVLAANVFDAKGKPLLQPYVKKQVGGKIFAILGLVTKDTPIVTHPDNVKGLTFRDPIEVTKEWVPKLRQEADHAKSLGRVDLYYHGEDLVHFSGGLLKYDEAAKPDPAVAAIVESLKKETDTLLNEKIDVTKRNLYDVLPFPNTLAVVEMKGSDLKAALENGVSENESGSGRFPQIARMSFAFDVKQPKGSRVTEVKVGGKALEEDKTYHVATNDFLIGGGDGYSMFMNKKSLERQAICRFGPIKYSDSRYGIRPRSILAIEGACFAPSSII
ncbi:5'-nucleotidase C-terminal domain-containing protein [Paenibacillus melissococcoides]|uniref:5'-nucleotidase C-terminal domain-containing protein n=1 Tax=Paenibacillus melissococcoides TaxID=2912268 RepID=A0ABM9FZS0_9BACL|nr:MULTISPECIES: 5'-nucleotidase C-terminal domain-containing protein [Paenibacillus]MEB9893575.1 5'-nucleotidase C-terminal domain-containing protein [Bacillus cereus]CAH8244820.1 5'-nucleotidase C-terminal domain-containing protein [Paenibacillus melissococcoides]CAH8709072.1 5'-nucleotidase C-terminal domain-containing protein [Paenibacillus melissococcoides]CAH8709827.1 5'-nucleotidase C-terminal domain-containing protein [Paenibacillus melissococcoides]GIO80637.1 hypothetical protein J6TS